MISNIHKNILGTISFDGKFGKMRKEQDFIVYPFKNSGENAIEIQSEHRFGVVDITGKGTLSANHAQYANSLSLQLDQWKGKAESFTIPPEQFQKLLEAIRGTAGKMVGESFVKCDNSGAAQI